MVSSRYSRSRSRFFDRLARPCCNAVRKRPRAWLLVEGLEERWQPSGAQGLAQIDHFVIIYQENWSFDSLYPDFPGANGIANAVNPDGSLIVPQVDKSGNPLTRLPPVLGPDGKPDPRFPTDLPVQPYDAVPYLIQNAPPGDEIASCSNS